MSNFDRLLVAGLFIIVIFILGVVSNLAFAQGSETRSSSAYTKAALMPHFYKAEDMYHLPTNILYGIAEAESGFRPEVINCEIVSSKGAKGLMQILPKFHPDAKPCDPVHSIYYAARYLFWIKDTLNTNNWAMIIGSYHWGLNNAKSTKPKDYPEPVKDYVLFVLNEIHWKLWLMGERP